MLQVELKVLEGRQQGKTIPLNVKQFLIGREQDCHLRPNSDLVSRHHCVFTVDDFTVRLRDLGSTNGTFVNGERLAGQVVLKPGDHVVVGKLSFEIVVRQGAPVVVEAGGKTETGSSIFPSTEPARTPDAMDTAVNVSDTMEFPAGQPDGDTAVIGGAPAVDPAAQAYPPQGGYMPQQQYGMPGYGIPPGYGMPPGYAMPGYPTAPGYPPGYPPAGYGMPPGYGMPQGYGMQQPMPGYGMPQQPQAPAAPAPSAASNLTIPEVILPDPETTGAKDPAPAPPPPAAEATAEGAAPSATQKKPSDAAADIIRMHRLRRPG